VAAWPAVALVGSYELLMMVIRGSQVPADGTPATGHDMNPLQEQAAELFAGQLAADRVPSVRAIRAELHVGQARAQMERSVGHDMWVIFVKILAARVLAAAGCRWQPTRCRPDPARWPTVWGRIAAVTSARGECYSAGSCSLRLLRWSW